MTRQASLYHSRERRRDLNRKRSFSGQVASPFALGSVASGGSSPNALSLLDSIEIGISFSASVTAGQLTVATNTGRTISTPALDANQIHRLGFIEKGVDLTPSCSVAGDVTIHILDQWRRPFIIATGTFT